MGTYSLVLRSCLDNSDGFLRLLKMSDDTSNNLRSGTKSHKLSGI